MKMYMGRKAPCKCTGFHAQTHSLSTLRAHSEHTNRAYSEQSTLKAHQENTQSTFRTHPEHTKSQPREHSDPDQRTSRSEHIQSALREYLVSTCKPTQRRADVLWKTYVPHLHTSCCYHRWPSSPPDSFVPSL